MFAYTVTCEFEDPAVAREWVDWLREEHLRDVCAAGALDGEVVAIDGGKICDVRYHFENRDAFEQYERDHAPRLRSEGLKRFPPERGLKYTRKTGEVVATLR